ncbi:MAG: serine hydrolase domain-containing protein [Anaerolineae bacterium]
MFTIALVTSVLFRPPVAPRGDTAAVRAVLEQRLDQAVAGDDLVGGALLLLEDGAVASEHYAGLADVGRPVTQETVFQLASVSKAAAAWVVMTLVDDGLVELDAPVSRYVEDYTIPSNDFSPDAVTTRRLLSHTAGLTAGLGYLGFVPPVPTQSLEQSLLNAADTAPGRDGIVQIGEEPGAGWRYSGGGYTILQLLVEEVTGEPFAHYAQTAVLDPLGIEDAAFGWDEAYAGMIAQNYTEDGELADLRRFTALAAAEMYATAPELAQFTLAAAPGPSGEPVGRGILSPELAAAMTSPHPEATVGRTSVWGLGYQIHAEMGPDHYVAGHIGNNRPGLNHAIVIDPVTGDGIVALGTGGTAAVTLTCDWMVWYSGTIPRSCEDLYLSQAVLPVIVASIAGLSAIVLWQGVIGPRVEAAAQKRRAGSKR